MSAGIPFRAALRVARARPTALLAGRAERALVAHAPAARAPAFAARWASGGTAPSGAPPPDAPGKDGKPDPYEVPPLGRPLGVTVPPRVQKKTWAKTKENMLDKERSRVERKALVKEATQGYFHDYHLSRKANGGKLWIAPPVLIRADRALYFPDINGKALTGEQVHTTPLLEGKVSLVTILSTRVSEEHIQSFVEPVLEDWEGQPLFNYVQINHQPNPLKSMLLSFFVSSLKRTIPQGRWGSYMISSGEWSEYDINGPLGLENKMIGYVFLVDEDCKVRWAGCAAPRSKEVEDLRRATAVLMRRKLGDGADAGDAPAATTA